MFHDAQADAHALRLAPQLRTEPVEPLEDALVLGGRDAGAVVDDPQLDPGRSRGGIHELELAIDVMDAIFNDKKKILPCAAYLEGEYGINGLFVGVPVVLGAGGIERIIELKLTPEESAALKKSAASVQELVGLLTV